MSGKAKKPDGPYDVQVYTVKQKHGAWVDKNPGVARAWAGGDASRVTEETRTFHPYDHLGMMSQKPTDEIVRTENSQ